MMAGMGLVWVDHEDGWVTQDEMILPFTASRRSIRTTVDSHAAIDQMATGSTPRALDPLMQHETDSSRTPDVTIT